ncbi:serine protease 33-like isoform X2 [Syngnathoides biaculeatus]|uniref:serine protease 33-like isoform X2 n=1 Tax=Syngnathoides biaculeatus TaxID=300417 RepID=UPI002ADD89ED|nr:serine protease 33-like isoform X2 [Syngnathoides biaculeatus]
MTPRTTWALLLGVILTIRGDSQAQECGTAPLNSRIVGGDDAPAGAWPWQVSMHWRGAHICGGNVISREWVLTAAHCIPSLDPSPWLLYFGKQNQSTTSPNEVNRTVARIIIHPDYDNETLQNDVTLMRLSSPLVFSDYIRPVCMASNSSAFNNGTRCWGTGWGRLSADEPNEAFERLQEVEIPIIGNRQCACSYTLVENVNVTSNMICAGEENRGICQGDSGGPVQCRQGSTWILAGVASFGVPCALRFFPEVFVRVSFYQNWITAQAAGADISFVTFTSTGPDQDDNFVCPLTDTSSAPLSSLSILLFLLCIQALQAHL